jgi:hypothetical protein
LLKIKRMLKVNSSMRREKKTRRRRRRGRN